MRTCSQVHAVPAKPPAQKFLQRLSTAKTALTASLATSALRAAALTAAQSTTLLRLTRLQTTALTISALCVTRQIIRLQNVSTAFILSTRCICSQQARSTHFSKHLRNRLHTLFLSLPQRKFTNFPQQFFQDVSVLILSVSSLKLWR